MFAGHFGVATVVKSKYPELPLWSLLVSTQLLDLVFIPFSLGGLESIEPIGEGGYGSMAINAFYTHSLVGALIISLLAGIISGQFWGKNSGVIIGLVSFSHWILDLIVHRPDLPILPGNIGDLPLLGFGLWNSFIGSFLLEFLLIAVGCFFYFRYLLKKKSSKEKRGKIIIVGSTITLLFFLSLVWDAFL
ncbi:permease [Sutcliffiella cohnii]|uniref:Permease n=1 Tax=Sutcliffiella cohnii TaxID=33932 RepID=A0A223KK56_9BACI|nr:permease [Sutcliffiella cohnii]AST89875.1 permease [Sutcliffiella cohnii]